MDGVTLVDRVNLSTWFDLHVRIGQQELSNGLHIKAVDKAQQSFVIALNK